MERIYSRRRFNPRLKKFTKIKIALAFCLIGFLIFIIGFIISVYPIFEEACINKAESIGTDITSVEVNKVMSNFDYDDLVYVERGEGRRDNNDKSKSCTN